MIFSRKAQICSILTAALLACAAQTILTAQKANAPFALPTAEPALTALPLPEDRGYAAAEQSLKRLSTTASVMMIVAHPDDEDGPLLAYLSRGMGTRVVLLTLTRGEGGQNAMAADTYDALGIIRTNELLRADEFYGTKQLWGTEADFGFSKTQEEAFQKWGHDRVLYDAVLAVRRERPQVIVSTFVGGVTDGHGHHQVAGEIAQEVFKAAGDPKIFPEQLKNGLQPWQPLAVYSMAPFSPVTAQGMFDYATGKWAPAKFKNYITGEWTEGALSADVTIPVGTRDAVLGRSYVQIAREGWGEQKSQYGGANPALSGPAMTRYHLWAVASSATHKSAVEPSENSLFVNSNAHIPTDLAELTQQFRNTPASWTNDLQFIQDGLRRLTVSCAVHNNMENAHTLAKLYQRVLELRRQIAESNMNAADKSALSFEVDIKIEQFQDALRNLLGVEMLAVRTNSNAPQGGGGRGASAEETSRSVYVGENLKVLLHVTGLSPEVTLVHTGFTSADDMPWRHESAAKMQAISTATFDEVFPLTVPENTEPTQPYFTRSNIEQPYYDLSHQEYRLRSFAPWPLAAWVELNFDGLPIRISQVVQTMQRTAGPGGTYTPLIVTPKIGVRIAEEAQILPLDGSPLPVRVVVHTQGEADGKVMLKLPERWHAEPASISFHRDAAGDTEPLVFSVTSDDTPQGAYLITAVAHVNDQEYTSGWQTVGYPGLRPYNLYRQAQLQTSKMDVKLAQGLHVAYVMGTGDTVPDAMEGMGVKPHLLSATELLSGDLSTWDVIVVGIRAYSVRSELSAAQTRLQQFVERGGTLIVQYQSANFPAPLPLSMDRTPERVVDETTPVKLLDEHNPLLTTPNLITEKDFNGWVEERGHSFLKSWDSGYTALTETADPGQDPQRGGLLVTHPGKGTYIYVAYALHRQFPELVPGAYRLFANLLSAGR